jgi:hypothetical protein
MNVFSPEAKKKNQYLTDINNSYTSLNFEVQGNLPKDSIQLHLRHCTIWQGLESLMRRYK